MSASREPQGANKDYSPSVFSQDTIVGSDANSLHPLIRNADDGGSSQPLRGTDRQPAPTDDFHYVTTREMPRAKAPTDPESRFGRLKNLLKPPVVKAVEALPSHEGKTYHVNEQGQVVETTTRRAVEYREACILGGRIADESDPDRHDEQSLGNRSRGCAMRICEMFLSISKS
ncbi:LOW QUALITY PROTEIN: uncharacterized protein LY79DRAFT_593830 [Colletotrichum navitas]|uniref:Uncharacterized protein n=1 Tax=Colletotrichum navitas TaxID=681940 RepID=A0AAD8PP03_9PEZI|nr:LOW QUALITY PROTEIN: uncharacterized protein LY79DRAFT_593830 [Colletotrichum navitas]KAK1573587.1 LOW QUALITY PROTEIN: hypothetical protein LY79DRAFT_593830 [Colletotrichum navitas]